jgi:hypothetical protein
MTILEVALAAQPTNIWITLAPSIVAIAALIVTYFSTINTLKNNHTEKEIESKRLHNEKIKEVRRDEIYKQLNEFYAPFQQYLNISKELYKIFFIGKPNGFMALTYFLDPNQLYEFPDGLKKPVLLTSSDKELLDQIFIVGQTLENLIVEKSGLVESKELRYDYTPDPNITYVSIKGNGLLAIAKIHFQIIRLAYQGNFQGEEDRLKNYVFPRELPIKIEKVIESLQKELKTLSSLESV